MLSHGLVDLGMFTLFFIFSIYAFAQLFFIQLGPYLDSYNNVTSSSMVKVPALAAPQLAPGASSARAWRIWAAPHSQGGSQPLGAQPRPQLLERAAPKVGHLTAFWPSRSSFVTLFRALFGDFDITAIMDNSSSYTNVHAPWPHHYYTVLYHGVL